MENSQQFYRSHPQMRMSVYADLFGIDAVAFPWEGGAGALLDVSKLNKRFNDRDLVEDRVMQLMKVALKHPNALTAFLVVASKNGKRNLYRLDNDAKSWKLDAKNIAHVISAAASGERL
jgi:hypothetical protein